MADRNLPEVWEVEWEDSSATHGWQKSLDVDDWLPDISTSVGFLIADDSRRVALCSSAVHMAEKEYDRHSRFDCVTAIPKSAVRKMRRLRKERK